MKCSGRSSRRCGRTMTAVFVAGWGRSRCRGVSATRFGSSCPRWRALLGTSVLAPGGQCWRLSRGWVAIAVATPDLVDQDCMPIGWRHPMLQIRGFDVFDDDGLLWLVSDGMQAWRASIAHCEFLTSPPSSFGKDCVIILAEYQRSPRKKSSGTLLDIRVAAVICPCKNQLGHPIHVDRRRRVRPTQSGVGFPTSASSSIARFQTRAPTCRVQAILYTALASPQQAQSTLSPQARRARPKSDQRQCHRRLWSLPLCNVDTRRSLGARVVSRLRAGGRQSDHPPRTMGGDVVPPRCVRTAGARRRRARSGSKWRAGAMFRGMCPRAACPTASRRVTDAHCVGRGTDVRRVATSFGTGAAGRRCAEPVRSFSRTAVVA